MGGKSPYLYRLEKGKHTLRLEVSLGEFAPLIREVESSLYNLNEMYRKILMITGTKPDEYRDYQIEKKVPNILNVFEEESERLKTIAAQLVKLSGQSSDQEALLKTMSLQLDEMVEKPDTIPRRLGAYKTNTGGLGTWVQQARQQPLEIDALYVASPDKKFPKKGWASPRILSINLPLLFLLSLRITIRSEIFLRTPTKGRLPYGSEADGIKPTR